MIERKFIEENIKSLELEEYFRTKLERADYSHKVIKITPLSTKITIYVGKPGIAIGKNGETIKQLTQTLTDRFNIKNPQLDIQTLENPDLDALVIATGIANGLERKMKPGRLTNIYLRKIMNAGAVGAEITIGGKISGSRGRTEKVLRGYIKKCGDMVEENVDKSEASAVLKQGKIGIKVKILPYLPKSLQIEKEIKKLFKKKEEKENTDKNKTEEKPTENKDKKETEEKKDKNKKTDTKKTGEKKGTEKKEEKKDIKKKTVKKEDTKKKTVKKDKKTKPTKKETKDNDNKDTKKEKKTKAVKPKTKKE